MMEDELRRIEAELRLALPDDYRRVVMAFPFQPTGRDRVYWLYNDADEVIRATRSPLNEFDEGRSWRPTYLSIGETAMGDQYLVDVARTPTPVLCLSHETHEVEEEFPDLAAFVAYWTREATAMEAVGPSRPRRWWRFWG